MSGAFASYLALKGIKKIIKIDIQTAIIIGFLIGVATWAITKPIIAKQSVGMENRNKSLKQLFNIPLIVSAALLSFAHGANDVANAVGPLAAIVQASSSGELYYCYFNTLMGNGYWRCRNIIWLIFIRPQACSSSWKSNYKAKSNACLLCRAICCYHSDSC